MPEPPQSAVIRRPLRVLEWIGMAVKLVTTRGFQVSNVEMACSIIDVPAIALAFLVFAGVAEEPAR